jgi:hypothetical protein
MKAVVRAVVGSWWPRDMEVCHCRRGDAQQSATHGTHAFPLRGRVQESENVLKHQVGKHKQRKRARRPHSSFSEAALMVAILCCRCFAATPLTTGAAHKRLHRITQFYYFWFTVDAFRVIDRYSCSIGSCAVITQGEGTKATPMDMT